MLALTRICSGLYPGMIFYLTLFYRRTELARRLGAFFASGAIANAFTGLIAYGVRYIYTPILRQVANTVLR